MIGNLDKDPLRAEYVFDPSFERKLALKVKATSDLRSRKQDAAAMLAALDYIEALEEEQEVSNEAGLELAGQVGKLREVLLTVAKDAHGPGYPTEHSFSGGPVKMHPHTLMLVDEVLAATERKP